MVHMRDLYMKRNSTRNREVDVIQVHGQNNGLSMNSSGNIDSFVERDDFKETEHFNFPLPPRNKLNDAEATTAILFGVLMFIVGILGNMLLLLTFTCTKRLRVTENFFTALLAASDTVIVGVLLLMNIVTVSYRSSYLSHDACVFFATLTHVCFTTSVLTLMLISVNRYIKVCHPNRYKSIFQPKWNALMAICVLSMGQVFAFPLYHMNNGFIYDPTLCMCIFNRFGNTTYTAVYLITCLLLPIVVTTLCYRKIYKHLLNSKRRLRRRRKSEVVKYQHESSINKSNFIIFVAYLTFYMPFGAIAIFCSDYDDIPPTVHLMSIYLCFANSCINCFIYGIFNRNIRDAYKEILRLSWLFVHNRINADVMTVTNSSSSITSMAIFAKTHNAETEDGANAKSPGGNVTLRIQHI